MEYKTVGDKHVREEHSNLNGEIRPITHSFWNTYYPPNGWRCRCYVVSTNKEANGDDVPVPDKKTVPALFRQHVGITKAAFPLSHPYLKNLKRNKVLYDFVAKHTPFQLVKTFENGSKIYVSPFAHNKDFNENFFTAIQIAKNEKKTTIEIMPHLYGSKNPEFRINGIIGDRISATNNKTITNTFRGVQSKYKTQLKSFDKSFLVFDFQDRKITNALLKDVAYNIKGRMNSQPKNKLNFFIFRNNVVKITPKMTEEKILKELKKGAIK